MIFIINFHCFPCFLYSRHNVFAKGSEETLNILTIENITATTKLKGQQEQVQKLIPQSLTKQSYSRNVKG